ncbi:MAG: hypothetical protein QOF60_3428 [Actinomycetota bacterium]|nr:hypothetical protein [Actinomycetota bacterium]
MESLRDVPYGSSTVDELHLLEQMLWMPLDWRYDESSATETLLNEIQRDGERALDVVDAVLAVTHGFPGSYTRRRELEGTLSIGGSAWRVVDEGDDVLGRLERRVEESAEAAARSEMSKGGNPSYHLRESWSRVYGRNQDPGGAYREAVRAVEAAAKPVVSPNDRVATLGKMIQAMRDKPEKWEFDLGKVEALTELMAQLWTAQLDRHGTDDETHPLSVSAAEAEAAVHVAASVVHLFRNGHVRPV